jgi:hypothetical protein
MEVVAALENIEQAYSNIATLIGENINNIANNNAITALIGAQECVREDVDQGRFAAAAAVITWPPSDGFLGAPTMEVLPPGTLVERYGFEDGSFVCPVGTPFPMRSLPASYISKPYHVYLVKLCLSVWAGPIAPAFGQPGLGIQYQLPLSVDELVAQQAVSEVK